MFIAALIGLIVLVVVLSLVQRSRRGAKRAPAGKHPLDGWIEESLARELARRLELEQDVLLRTLQGQPEPEVVGAVEEAVRSVEVRFSRLPTGAAGAATDEYEVRVDANLERGGAVSATRRLAGAELPAAVREDFARTAASMVFRGWELPWSRPAGAASGSTW